MERRSDIGRVGIVAKAKLHPVGDLLTDMAAWLTGRGVTAVLDTETASLASATTGFEIREKDRLPLDVDLIVVLGGDGTLLGMADRIAAAGADIPILGVNFGSLGFLTEITLPELYPSMASALEGTARIEERLMLRARTMRSNVLFADRIVLNDVVITKGALSRIIDLSVWVDDQLVSRFKADGLIIASPTGSTAYNLASGGPIVHPLVDALLITPIAPHTLTNRPLAISGRSEVGVQPLLENGNAETYVTFDGQSGFQLQAGDLVTVRSAERPLRLITASTRSYFEVLREKLKWGER
jgi:NAD+ kinase